MNIRNILFSLSAVLFSFSSNGQSSILPDIEAKLNDFITYSNQQDWDKAFDLLYPKLFTRATKQDLMDVMEGMGTDGMSLYMSNTRITSTSVPIKEGHETFVRVEYTADLTVQIEKNGIYDAPKPIYAMDEQFRTTYGDQNVRWDPVTNEFHIKANKRMMAVDTGEDGWKLVEINLDQPELMQYLFSPSIMAELVRVQ